MSRIHEALQRADQERKSRAASHSDPQLQQSESGLSPLPEPPSEARTDDHNEAHSSDEYTTLPPSDQESTEMDAVTSRCRSIAWNPQDKALLFSQEKSHQYKAEIFRTLRSRLYRLRDQLPLHRLLITSTLPAEGKSFVALNLTHAIAQQHGRRALLIDADLRMPRQHILLGAPQSPGLSEYLRGEADEYSIIQRGSQHDLYLISCGQTGSNPVELISNARMRQLLDRLRRSFDWIVVDSPPMAPVSDASVLADMCDGALLVVRASATPYDLAQKACADFQHTPLVGVVLNGVERTANYGSYYYNYYSGEPAGD